MKEHTKKKIKSDILRKTHRETCKGRIRQTDIYERKYGRTGIMNNTRKNKEKEISGKTYRKIYKKKHKEWFAEKDIQFDIYVGNYTKGIKWRELQVKKYKEAQTERYIQSDIYGRINEVIYLKRHKDRNIKW